MRRAIGIIGFGNMGQAIAEGIKSKYKIWVFDKDQNKARNLKNINVAKNSVDLIINVEIVILAVKPQDFDALLNEIKDFAKGKLVISIAAGISTKHVEKYLRETRVVRVMPNIGAKIKEAESILCKGKSAAREDLDYAIGLFNCIGKTWVMNEEMINAATAISGSGPAYIFYDLEIKKIDPFHVPEEIKQDYTRRLTEAAKKVGFDNQAAIELAASTTGTSLGLAAMGISPAKLRKQVTSKGGTTEAALKILIEGGSWEEAALAAKKRAEELAKKEIL